MPKLAMSLQQKPSIDLRPRMMMSAHMQQAIKILQLPIMELDDYLEEQVVVNPVLEFYDKVEGEAEETPPKELIEQEVVISDNDFTILKQLSDDFQEHFAESDTTPLKPGYHEERLKAFLDSSIPEELSLSEHLKQEARETFSNRDDIAAADILIGYIDEWGFLKTPLKEIAALHKVDISILKNVLSSMQTFEPYGIGAASIQESLLIQLRCQNKKDTLAYKIIADHYDDLLHHRITALQRKLKSPIKGIQEAIEKDIARLDLHPGTHYASTKSSYIIPDATILLDGEVLRVDVNKDHANLLKLNYRYVRMLENPDISLETKSFIRQHVLSAKWLMRNLQQRYSTIERITDALTIKQRDFFMEPNGQLMPLTMKTIADELEVHESTIARTVAHKYINTPRGLLPLRSFFTAAYVSDKGDTLSAKTIKDAIVEIIEKEDKAAPFTDEQIVSQLKERGMTCARRTIANYRSLLHLGNAIQRRKY